MSKSTRAKAILILSAIAGISAIAGAAVAVALADVQFTEELIVTAGGVGAVFGAIIAADIPAWY